MKTSLRGQEQGIAHLGLVLLVLVIFGAVGFAVYRINDAKSSETATVQQPESEDDQAVAEESQIGAADEQVEQSTESGQQEVDENVAE